jgi:hypothetical protein
MSESRKQRIHQYLDGESGRGDLSAEELREVANHEEVIAETGKLHRSIDAPDLTASIMSRLQDNPASQNIAPSRSRKRGLVRQSWLWLWAPRPVQLRPAYGFAAVAALLVLAVVLANNNPANDETMQPRGIAALSGKVFVQFRLDAPQASAVQLVGSFTGWEPAYTLNENAPGIWSVLVPLEPGVHDYAFLVNGKWIRDPIAAAVDDGFGGANSRLLVVLPDGGSRL